MGYLRNAILGLAAGAAANGGLQAQEAFRSTVPSLVFSADDQTSGYRANTMFVRPHSGPGALTALDFSVFPPRIWHRENVPCSVIGPPTCVASTPGGETILVAGAMKVDPTDPAKLTYDRRVTRLHWGPRGLEQVAQLEVGRQPSAVALANGGQRAYVTLRAEGTVAILDLPGRELRLAAVVAIAGPSDSLSDFALSPDGTEALASVNAKGAVLALQVLSDGLKVTQELAVSPSPYDIKFLPDGRRALVGDTRGETIVALAKDHGRWKIAQWIPVGHATEGVSVSPDGRWAAVSCFNGATSPGPQDRWYRKPSRIYLLASTPDGGWVQRQAVEVDSMPQSAVFTPDGHYLVAGEYGLGDLRIFRLEKGEWNDTGLHIAIPGQPAALEAAGR